MVNLTLYLVRGNLVVIMVICICNKGGIVTNASWACFTLILAICMVGKSIIESGLIDYVITLIK